MTATVTELGALADRLQEQGRNEDSPDRGRPLLDEASQGMTLADPRATAVPMRQALIAGVQTLPDEAFADQPADAEGNEVWSAGEVITHCNFVLMRFAERAAGMMGLPEPGWPDELAASGEQRVLDKDATIAAAELIDLGVWFDRIPADADIESSEELPRFGNVSGRTWLYFMAVHEADHVEQLEELRAAHS